MIAQIECRSTLKQTVLDAVLLETMVPNNSKPIQQVIKLIKLKIFTHKTRIKSLLEENSKLQQEMSKRLNHNASKSSVVSQFLKKNLIDLTDDDKKENK